VFAACEGGHGGDGVGVVGGGDEHGVDLFVEAVEHHAEVAEEGGVGEAFAGGSGLALVHIAESDEKGAVACEALDVAPRHVAAADGGEADGFAGRRLPALGDEPTRHDREACRAPCGAFNESPA
jgi:hypothetical protein